MIRYIRDNGQPIGVMATGFGPMGEERIGFSFCNPLDNFEKKRAVSIAQKRATMNSFSHIPNRKIFCDFLQKEITVGQAVENMLDYIGSEIHSYKKVEITGRFDDGEQRVVEYLGDSFIEGDKETKYLGSV